MVLGLYELALREEIRRTEADRARLLAGTDTGPAWTYRTIPPADEPPIARRDIDAITEAENRRDAETKTALSRLALGQLRIESKLDELLAETRAREPRTDYPHEDTDTDDRFV